MYEMYNNEYQCHFCNKVFHDATEIAHTCIFCVNNPEYKQMPYRTNNHSLKKGCGHIHISGKIEYLKYEFICINCILIYQVANCG